ncbi:PepSY domain-containing protein [Methanococcoides methylutens]|uniref:PepSY domain-containing protein n=1 Tax=Methanococcoides methylutens MM1 TaxID=1434104 RepID=A0A0E3SRY7_METMT|nr:PepSY domain-containing protein [Methanococcoides methylutens]AKB85826.1 hypothetical protein MCMEM_1773 [Methanococcoides methylutens MM1]
MRKITNIFLVGAILLVGAGMIGLTVQTDTVQAAYGSGPGAGWGGCPAYGSGYSGYNQPAAYSGYSDLNVESIEDALDIAREQIDADVSEENIYQMGRWWVVYYTNDDGVVMQSYIDAFTGEVVDTTDQTYNYANTGRGYGMMYGAGYGHGMGYGRMYRYW